MSDDDIELSSDDDSGGSFEDRKRPTSAGPSGARGAAAPRRAASAGRVRPSAKAKIESFMNIYSNGGNGRPPSSDRSGFLPREPLGPQVDHNLVEELKIETVQKSKVIRELQAERIKLKTRISRLETELTRADQELEQALAEKASGGSSAAQRQLAEHALISKLKSRVANLEKNVSVKDEEVAKLKNSQRQRRVRQMQESLDLALTQKRELEDQMAAYRTKVQDEFRGEYERLQRENKKLSQQVQSLKKPKGKKTEEDDDGLTQDERDRLSAERARLLKAKKDYEDQAEKIKGSAELAKNRIKDLLANEEQLREEIQKLKDQLARVPKRNADGTYSEPAAGAGGADDDDADFDFDDDAGGSPAATDKKSKKRATSEDTALAKQAARERVERDDAVKRIQAGWKGHVSRKTVKQLIEEKRSASKQQFLSDYEKIKERLKRMDAAVQLESQTRGLLARTNYHNRRNTAASRIQRVWRGHWAFRILQKLKFQKKLEEKNGAAEEARLAELRKQQEIDRLAEEENSRRLAAERLAQLKVEESMEKSATRIQALYRGHSVRMKRGTMIQERDKAATRIQASFRGFKDRRSFKAKYPLWPAEKFEMVDADAADAAPVKSPKELGYVFEEEEHMDYG